MVGDLRDWDIVSGVGITALMLAAGRAVETNRAEGPISDPFAEAFVQAADAPMPMPTRLGDITEASSEFDQRWNNTAVAVGARSKFFDEYFENAWATGVRQTVLLTVGLDTRAFRLDWPAGSTVCEIDQPKVLEFKDNVLDEQHARPRCTRRVVTIDLREDWASALLEAGFDTSQPTAWLAEGLLHYLPPQSQRQLLDTIRKLSVPGSWLAVTKLEASAAAMDRVRQAPGQSEINLSELFPHDLGDDPASYLAAQGWDIENSVTISRLVEQRYQSRLSPNTPPSQSDTAYHLHTARL